MEEACSKRSSKLNSVAIVIRRVNFVRSKKIIFDEANRLVVVVVVVPGK